MKPETKEKIRAFIDKADKWADWLLTRFIESKYTGIVIIVCTMIGLILWFV